MAKFCEKCGKELNENQDYCLGCGNKIGSKSNNQKKKMPVWAIILIAVICDIGIIGIVSSGNETTNKTTNKNSQKEEYEVNKPFEFDDLEITIGDEVTFVKLDNQFSEKNGSDVVKVPITVKNKKDESHNLNMFYHKIFGSQGTELESITGYFSDDDVDFAGELMPDASYTKYLHFLYDGDGVYTIKFDNFSKKIEFRLEIKK